MENNEKKIDNKSITDFEIDQLREVMNIGVSHASTALSQMIKKRVVITVPKVIIDKVENVVSIIGPEKEVVTAIILEILGDAPGMMTFIFPHDESGREIVKLINFITKQEDDGKKVLSEYNISVLKEVGNILCGASLTAFSKFLDINMVQSVSEAVTDMLGSIVNSVMAEIGQSSDHALIFKVAFKVEGEDINPELFFFIDPRATYKILESTKKKMVA